MSHRIFTDTHDRIWEVWEVLPTAVEKRGAERPVRVERRKRQSGPRLVLNSELRSGWLAFQSKQERRILAPLPSGWSTLSDEELRGLLEKAVSKGKPRRLIE